MLMMTDRSLLLQHSNVSYCFFLSNLEHSTLSGWNVLIAPLPQAILVVKVPLPLYRPSPAAHAYNSSSGPLTTGIALRIGLYGYIKSKGESFVVMLKI